MRDYDNEDSIIRKNSGKAVIRFLIGLVVLVLIAFAFVIFVLKGNFNDKLNTENGYIPMNYNWWDGAHVDATPAPVTLAEPEETETEPEGEEPTVQETAEPVVIPTPVPTPEPTPEPTPAPTAIPNEAFAQPVSNLKINQLTKKKFELGLSDCSKPEGTDGWALEIAGWSYVDNSKFDGEKCNLRLIVYSKTAKAYKFYKIDKVPGASGMEHVGEGKNLNACDFHTYLDVSKFQDGEYELGMALNCKIGGQTYNIYYTFGKSFFVYAGSVLDE